MHGFSSEDEALESTRETRISLNGAVSTRNSTPVSQQTIQQQSNLGIKSDYQVKRRRKKSSPSSVWKAKYTKAVFILGKIAENDASGTPHERDKQDRIKYQAVVDEYLKIKESLPKTSAVEDGSEGGKRNRSETEGDKPPKRSRGNGRKNLSQPISSATRRPFSEVVRDHLMVALAIECDGRVSPVVTEWGRIRSELDKLSMEYVLANPGKARPRFYTSEIHRGYRIIRCTDALSGELLGKFIAKISDAWDGLNLKLIQAKDIPMRPRARVWLPKVAAESRMVFEYLRLMNPEVPMDDWTMIHMEDSGNNSMSMVLSISESSVSALEAAEFKLFFGVGQAKVKILGNKSSGADGDIGDVAFTNEPQIAVQKPEPPGTIAVKETQAKVVPSGSSVVGGKVVHSKVQLPKPSRAAAVGRTESRIFRTKISGGDVEAEEINITKELPDRMQLPGPPRSPAV